MRRSDPLRGVLMMRRQKEEAEERRLAALGQEIEQAMVESERSESEFAEITASRLRDVQRLLDGSHYHCEEARYRQMQQQRFEAAARLVKLNDMRAEQMEVYLRARREHEVIRELQERRRLAYLARLDLLEQKRNGDLFLARWVRN
jgi:hypothetical protein